MGIIPMFQIPMVLIAIPFFISCTTPKPPDWINTRLESSDYWFGYGRVSKPFNGDIQNEARNRAIDEIASQISIQISSEMSHLITEHNYDINEYSSSLIKTRVNSNLENIEFIETFNGREEFIFLARLSQEKYYDTLHKKRLNAVETAMGYIKQADKSFSGSTFKLLDLALGEINFFLDEPIIVEYPEGSKDSNNLYPLIQLKISDYFNRIEIITDPVEINAKIGIPINQSIKVRVQDKKTEYPIKGIPLIGSIKGSNPILLYVDSDGTAEFILTKIREKTPTQSFKISVQNEEIITYSKYNTIMKSVSIKAIPPLISMISNEKNVGSKIESAPITESVKQLFQKMFSARFTTNENADININLNINTEKMSNTPNEYGLYITQGNLTINITNNTENEIFSFTLTDVMGRSFNDNHDAGLNAINNMQKILISKLKTELENVFYK